MHRSRSISIAVFLLAGAPLAAQQSPPPVDSATEAAIRQLLVLTGSGKRMILGIETMVPTQRAANPRMPAVFWDVFLAHARADTTQLMQLLIPIYASHLSQEDLQGLVQFYQTPLGRRVVDAMPLIMEESMQAGRSWGATIGRQVAESLAQSGVQFPNPQ